MTRGLEGRRSIQTELRAHVSGGLPGPQRGTRPGPEPLVTAPDDDSAETALCLLWSGGARDGPADRRGSSPGSLQG